MAVTSTETVARWIFTLQRGDEQTTRTINVPNPKTGEEDLQTILDTVAQNIVGQSAVAARGNKIIQPSNWRDSNTTEEEWTTTDVKLEIVSTSVTPYTKSE